MPGIQLHSKDWSIERTTLSRGGALRSTAAASSFPAAFLTSESEVAEEFSAQPSAAVRRGAAPASALDFSYDLAEGEAAVLAIRHPSGALTFHLPVESIRRGVRKSATARFSVPVHSIDVE